MSIERGSRQDMLRGKHVAIKRARNAAGIKSAQQMASTVAEEYARQQKEGVHLTEEQITNLMQLTPAEMQVWNMICQGRPPRNAGAILAGIKLKLEYTRKKPETAAEKGQAPVTVVINTIGPEAPQVTASTTPSAEDSVQ